MAVPNQKWHRMVKNIFFISLNSKRLLMLRESTSASNGIFLFVKRMLRKDPNSTAVVTSPFIIKNYGHMVSLSHDELEKIKSTGSSLGYSSCGIRKEC